MSTQAPAGAPSPALFFETVNSYQKTAAIKTAIELNLFTAIAEGNSTAQTIAHFCKASERGTRILCDYLCVIGFLTKTGHEYHLTQDSAVFLNQKSPAYLGGILEFMLSPMLIDGFQELTKTVQTGTTSLPEGGSVAPDHPVWVRFARGMAPMMAMPAQILAKLIELPSDRPSKVLDIAAGHGLYGIAFAQTYPQAQVTAVDWASVLEVAKENAGKAGVSDRHHTLPGSAFEVDFGTGYDIVLLTNFLHHFDIPTCEKLLEKIHASLADGGRVVTLEFVPNEDRVTPPMAAMFSLTMLNGTPAGDAYTFAQYDEMFTKTGYSRSELHELPPTIQRVVVSFK